MEGPRVLQKIVPPSPVSLVACPSGHLPLADSLWFPPSNSLVPPSSGAFYVSPGGLAARLGPRGAFSRLSTLVRPGVRPRVTCRMINRH
jgi:hypothetical protein